MSQDEREPVEMIEIGGKGAAGIEGEAERMQMALDALISIEAPQVEIARKHSERLRFARERLAELRDAASADGGAFAPARVEVATSILEANVQTAAAFVNRTLRSARRIPGRRTVQAVVDEAVATIEERRRAA